MFPMHDPVYFGGGGVQHPDPPQSVFLGDLLGCTLNCGTLMMWIVCG